MITDGMISNFLHPAIAPAAFAFLQKRLFYIKHQAPNNEHQTTNN